MTALPTIELTVFPDECDAFGHLNHAAVIALLERARWEGLSRGPGMDFFRRNGIAPVVRKVTADYRAPAYPGDVLRIETTVVHRGVTSWTLRHTAKRAADDAVIAEAEVVLVSVDGAGRPAPLPDDVARFLGPRTPSTHEARRVSVDGVELAVDVRGEGAPILFVHGFPFDRTMWRHQVAALSRWKRIAPDLRGAGDSGQPEGGYSMARYADDLIGVLDALGVRRTVVCGLSMGGYIIFELLRRYRDRVTAVVLCDTRAEADSADGRKNRDELIALAKDPGPAAVAERLLPRLIGRVTLAEQPEVVKHYREMAARISSAGMIGALRAMRDRPDSTSDLGQINVPALIVVGGEDQVTPPSVARELSKAIPGAELATIPAAGHLAPLEQPLATSRAIADFLERLS